MARTQITHNQPFTLEYYCPEGAPSSATLTLYTSGDATFSGETWPLSLTLGASTLTNQELARKGGVNLSVVSTAEFAARERYMLDLPNGVRREIRLEGVDTSAGDLVLDGQPSFVIPVGSAIASHRLAYTLSTSQTATKRRYCRAVWAYTVDGRTYVKQTFFDIVRQPFVIDVTEEDIEAHDKDFGDSVGQNQRWKKLLVGAHNDIQRMLFGLQIDPDEIRDREAIKDALIFCLLSKMAMPNVALADAWKERCQVALKDFQAARSWIDTDDDGRVDGVDTDNDHSDGIFSDNNRDPWSQGGSELGTPVKYMRVG